MNTQCKVCRQSNENKVYIVREMMFGYKDEFEYFECTHCGCLQIVSVPDNLGKYYPAHYYSIADVPDIAKPNPFGSYIKQLRLRYYLKGKGFLQKLVLKTLGSPRLYSWMKKENLDPSFKILDVGCGTGYLLLALRQMGFSKLQGIDPFIESDIEYKNGVRVEKKDLSEISGQFDLVMLHHSFEHMPDPVSTFKDLYRLVKPKRYLLIRIPIFPSFAWRKYGINWVQLDAPRHLFLHSIQSIQRLADGVGFSIQEIVYDSTPLQFWGSEQYVSGIPHRDERSYYHGSFRNDQRGSIFSAADIEEFRAKASYLNNVGDGDQACFYLVKN